MVDPHQYKRATVLALAQLGRGSCYWPDPPCPRRAIVMVKDEPMVDLDIAHICAASPDGPRYRKDMSDHQRRSFPNLLLLCTSHHKFVDRREREYPEVLLQKWKASRETGPLAALRGLEDLTDDDLPGTVLQAMRDSTRELRDAIDQLRQVNPDAASLLDAAELLSSAGLRDLADAAEIIDSAAARLPRDLADSAELLSRAASQLPRDLADSAQALYAAGTRLAHVGDAAEVIPDLLMQLDRRIQELRRLQDGF